MQKWHRSPKLSNADALRQLTRLTDLTIADCVKLKSIEFLRELTNLESLHIFGLERVRDFSPVGALRRLRTLSLNGPLFTELALDTSLLEEMKYLSTLDLGYWRISEMIEQPQFCKL